MNNIDFIVMTTKTSAETGSRKVKKIHQDMSVHIITCINYIEPKL